MEQEEKQSKEFPRQDLPFACSRRKFFRALFQEAVVAHGAIKGREGCRLSELGSLPDEQLAQIKPIVNRDYEIFVEQGHVWARYRRKEQAVSQKLFSTEQKNLTVFNMFDGRHRLDEAAHYLALETGWDEAEAFAHARALFLSLVQSMVCVPKDPLEPDR